MELQQEKPFIRTKLEINKETFNVRITDDMKTWFEEAKKIIQQPKNSTAIKQLAELGYYIVLHDEKIKKILATVLGNSKRNQRTGITESEYKIN